MAQVNLQGISKTYGETKALDNISIEINDREFVVLFGPAGAGKTTFLSILSGIISPDSGTVLFNNKSVNESKPNKRNVAMVFENYALYPHLNVYDNIAFPLRGPEFKQNEEKIKTAVLSVTKKMHISHLLDRLPSQLSNGQRQRVALGRALVRDPNIFLMDEPLAHLDAKLKNFMRTELKAIQQQLDTTTVYVTHDYLEALSLADKVIVINQGQIIQVGKPEDIYYRPYNTFVAKLVGEPEINLYECRLEKDRIVLPSADFALEIDQVTYNKIHDSSHKSKLLVGFRGIDIHVSFEAQEAYYEGRVVEFHSIGNKFVVNILHHDMRINTLISGDSTIAIGQKIFIQFQPQALFFRGEDGLFITRMGEI